MEVGPECQGNAGECLGNVREWVQFASGMQGIAGEYQGNVWEWVQYARGMQGNARGMYWRAKCHMNAGECKGVGVMCQGNAGECQGNILEWVQSAM